jgi:hemin uptake protein HemP
MTEPALRGAADHDGIGAAASRHEATGASRRVVTSQSLLAGDAQLAILHDQTVHFLRQTRYGRQILAK